MSAPLRRPAGEIGPKAYVAWRASALGSITEQLERRVVLDLAGDLRGRATLDVGCGDGALAIAVAQQGARITGVDADWRMLTAARWQAKALSADLELVAGRAECLPFLDRSFDVVLAITLLCFVPDAAQAVRECARVLRPGGRLVIGELGKWSLWAARRRVLAWLGSGIWRSARFRTEAELRALVEGAGLVTEEVRGAIYYPPVGALARLMAPLDKHLSRVSSVGAAFLALRAVQPALDDERVSPNDARRECRS